jgi:hypothetical protein
MAAAAVLPPQEPAPLSKGQRLVNTFFAPSKTFTFQNPVATNPGYFIDRAAHPVLGSLLTSFDIFTIWTLALTAIGITCISKVKRGTAFAVVFGWFGVVVLIGVGLAAAF